MEPSAETTALYEQIQVDALRDTRSRRPQPVPPQRGMPVFLFTDIEGSTPLWENHREVILPALLDHNRILEEQITLHGGRILELRGDGVKAPTRLEESRVRLHFEATWLSKYPTLKS